MGLFGNKAAKQAKNVAADAESARLSALPVRELAAEIMPAFGPDGMNINSGHEQGLMEVSSWLTPDVGVKHRVALGPLREALAFLEHALLLNRRSFGSSGQGSTYDATRLGLSALAAGTVRKELGIA